MSRTLFRYGLWGLTLGTLWWALAIVSAVVASKGGDNDIKAVPGLDSGAGEVLGDA